MTGLDVQVYEAEDGFDAMEKAFRIRPDIVITDLNMPKMSGEELVERIHQADELQATRVLVLSADHSAARPDQLAEAGAAVYLTKPVSPEKLRRSLVTLMGDSQ